MRQKILIVMMVMAVSVFLGCGRRNDTGSNNQTTTEEQGSETNQSGTQNDTMDNGAAVTPGTDSTGMREDGIADQNGDGVIDNVENGAGDAVQNAGEGVGNAVNNIGNAVENVGEGVGNAVKDLTR